jgi:soluble lytic murein transglycosylase
VSASSRQSSTAQKKASTLWRSRAHLPHARKRSATWPSTRLFAAGLLMATVLGLILTTVLYLTDDPRPEEQSATEGLTEAEDEVERSQSIQLRLAEESARLGDYERAIAILGAAVSDNPESHRLFYQLARTKYEAGDGNGSLAVLDEYLERFPEAENRRQALLLRGELKAEVGDLAGAALDFAAYTETNGPAASRAFVRLGDIADQSNNTAAAARYYSQAIGGGISSYAESRVMLILVDLHRSNEDTDAAAYWAQRVVLTTPLTRDRISALASLADIKRQSGDRRAWIELSTQLIEEFPESTAALEALNSLLASGVGVSAIDHARILLANDDLAGAQDRLLEAVAGPEPEEAAEAAFQLGLLRELAGDPKGALSWFSRSRPSGSARYAEELELHSLENQLLAGNGEYAADELEQFAIEHRGGVLSVSAAYALARWHDSQSEADAQAEAWLAASQFALEVGDSQRAVQAARRAESLFTDAGQPEAASSARLTAISADPGSLEAIQAVQGLDRELYVELRPYYAERSTEEWLNSFAGGSPGRRSSGPDRVYNAAEELQLAGLSSESESEIVNTASATRYNPVFLHQVVVAAGERELDGAAARVAAIMLENLPSAQQQEIPTDLGRTAYPRPYLELVESEAEKVDIDPLLLYALIRQESFFDPRAHSSADARGLTQIIPSTGHDIARALDVEGFSPDDLFRVDLSLAFGAHYLDAQLEAFGGYPHVALAAYNGGPGNARRWSSGGLEDIALYLDRIDFEETYNYVRRVMENYAHYRAIYLGYLRPHLPEPSPP